MADENTYDELVGAAGSTRSAPLIRAPADDVPMAACPARPAKPRDLEQHRAAVAAADGDAVEEIDACGVRADMTIWYPDPAPGRWRPVKDWHVEDTKTVIDFLVAPPYSSSWTLASDQPVCRRITQREARHVLAG